jgi:arylsulfatase A-like enzyme
VNVILYVSDALRADHVGCYGARFVNTRTLDELAASGARFEQVVASAPWTAPAMTSLVTGLYPHRHGVLDWSRALPDGVETLFHAFARSGYAVASYVFDDEFLYASLPEANVRGRSGNLDEVVQWLREHAGAPFFLLVHSWATHMPYDAEAHGDRDWASAKRLFIERIQANRADALEEAREAYRQAVERQSEVLVASLLHELERLGIDEQTTVAFTADHGETWGERFADKTEVRGVYHLHGAALYDEALLVPLILRAPQAIEPSLVVPTQVRSVDLAPTVLELAGIPAFPCDGESLGPLLRGPEAADRTALSVTSDRGAVSLIAVRRPPWKVIRQVAPPLEEAYRIDLDPRERENALADAPAELRALLERELETMEPTAISEEEEALISSRLERLGYL